MELIIGIIIMIIMAKRNGDTEFLTLILGIVVLLVILAIIGGLLQCIS